MKKLKKVLIGFFAIIGFLVVGLIAALFYFAGSDYESAYTHPMPNRMILAFDAADGIGENEGNGGLIDLWNGYPISTRKAVMAIRAAAQDERVLALAMRVDNVPLGLARIQELREAVLDFRSSGKPAYAYADTFGAEADADNAYYLASAFSEIWMQPSGDWGVLGVNLEMPFVRGLLDKLGIKPVFGEREDYKSAMRFLTDHAMQPADKNALGDLARNIFTQKISGIAKDRGIAAEKISGYIDSAPLSSGQALTLNLIDTLGYATQLLQKLQDLYGSDAGLIHLADYAAAQTPASGDPRVAVIYASGEVVRGSSENSPSHGWDETFFADDIADALHQASNDKDIAAIVLRINSPGGSYIASDTVWDAVMNAKKSGKPVIAVMGDVAASGGYFVAMAADKIYAMPATLTGSIGVVAGKIAIEQLAQKLGVGIDGIKIGDNADMWSMTRDFTPAGRKKLDEFLDRSYADFLQKAAAARNLSVTQMRVIAKGRVWSGEQAKSIGLIDGTGGWVQAESDLRDRLALADHQEIAFESYPKPKPPIEELLEHLSRFGSMADANYQSNMALMTMARQFPRLMTANGVSARMPWLAEKLAK